MTDVKSKNLYELLGNTSDQDSDREPELPTQTKEKPTDRRGKRDGPKAAPAAPAAPTEPADTVAARGRGGNRRGGFTGNEAAFRDRATGRNKNREQAPEENDDSGRGGRGRGRGRGGPRRGGDRHSRTGIGEHQKQSDHGWGESTGQGEWQDEKAGQEIANEEKKEGGGAWDAEKNDTWNENAQPATIPEEGPAAIPEPEAEPEPEDNSKSYADYLAEQNAKRMKDLGLKEARAPNEGSKENKKWKSAKELTKEEDENYFKGEEKARRQRERGSAKQLLDIDYAFKEQSRGDSRGGRGGRGGRGRGRGDGEFSRADRGDRGDFRGRGRGDGDRGDRGDFRGRGRGRGGDFRGEFRGGRGDRGRGRPQGDGAPVAVDDESAFPSLGGK